MDLAELVGLRPTPCAGLLVTLTQRCPLSCAHCSTSSTMRGGEPEADRLRGFVSSFTRANRPELMLLTGGEPLLRPGLVAELAAAARVSGCRTALLSGMFFARQPRIPAAILAAITSADHFSASIDAFHEREVSRADVFRALHAVLAEGLPVSLHITGTGPDDPYLAELTADVRRTFGGRVPMLVNEVRALGRAASWAGAARTPGPDGRPLPCAMAAWPVIAHDGAVLACCNQDTADRRPVPPHLLLGDIARDGWAEIRERSLTAPALRMLRSVGPGHLYARYGDLADCTGYCTGCRSLGEHPGVLAGAERDGAGAVGELLDLQAASSQRTAGPAALVRRFGSPRYADLVTLSGGAPQ
ncbi:radical SAM protein [Kitasatospora sp. MAP5-34]|uniref:radical SAM protein n=1 Tax=Kitasatospora sp. MAP5-34 TaxID=3035102 RepID=UPI00247719F6|nr:radical SAM protein [Kitasatospora sp. MAP5-34]MDH6578737.1 pyruvate-formate lyase-activating enzyme [Kitasatospora sp. MAP5-34]